MQLLVIGLNHKTAPVAMREQLAFAAEDLPIALDSLKVITQGAVILSTCNRTEIYALAPEGQALTSTMSQVIEWLAAFKNTPMQKIAPHLYQYQNNHALLHWVRVASGLDSMILGEPQILGQIKQAVRQSRAKEAISSKLSWVIQQVFAAAKQVRNETRVGSQAVSLGFAAAKLVTQIFQKPSNNTLLVVAAGEMNRLVATNIAGLGVGKVIICNRSLKRAALLASELETIVPQIEITPLDQLPSVLPQADIVTSCSGSLYTLIDKTMVKQALKQRRHQPMLMIDLAVPRDIDPTVSELDDVYLYSIDDLQHVIAGNLEQRRQAAVEAELLVSQIVVAIERKYLVRQVGQDIQQYREQAKHHADMILSQSLQQLADGHAAEAVLTELTRKLTQTLTHAPSKLLRETASEQPVETVNFVAQQLTHAFRKDKCPYLTHNNTLLDDEPASPSFDNQ
ncbi:glutamyl-tRNA reductase [Moraxella osloensis]|uniref:Glutamyl-tRNA reductase n=1 Tax=Faucicola osloensis TaxID=34062 RepID=A0A378QCC2_FAUOS|nr:glutamyl-tRNA reductase [Moraxella osloensis]AME01627.1 glutamyl-tRNA reductase [Moraxella osloensis]OBX56371.1 glutamyl-tRNA reductase [Moraxella osloensis]QPT42643.1 glutamyl-tRNA reductase [Moraxella osloensis]STY98322.1 Glutamyl-tRNA reductase [Moraxella osloensis]